MKSLIDHEKARMLGPFLLRPCFLYISDPDKLLEILKDEQMELGYPKNIKFRKRRVSRSKYKRSHR